MGRACKTPHTGCRPGKRVRIVLRDGQEIIGKFKDRDSRHVMLEDGQKIEKSTIRTFGLYRPRTSNTTAEKSIG